MKKIFALSLLALLGFATHAIAAEGFTALAPITGLTDSGSTSVINSDSLANFFNNLYKYLIGLAATLAVIEIIWGGLEISTKDSVSKQSDGKERITQAIFGLILVLSPVLVFSIINPSILNLSLNLPELDTKSGGVEEGAGGTTGTGSVSEASSAGCSASNNQGEVACPTQEAANSFAASCSNGSGRVFLSNQSSLPYAASCNVLQPFQGNRNYTDAGQIQKGYWCYTARVYERAGFLSDPTVTTTYVCGATKDSCDALVLGNTVGGDVVAGCKQY